MRRSALFVLTVAAVVLGGATADAAQRRAGSTHSASRPSEDGALVGLHELRREGNRMCMVEHTHVGTSGGQPSRKAAEGAAIRDWVGFTAWEYGDQWGSAVLAASKTMTCTGGGASHGCEFVARPCRR
jgi:hypothetical protein